VFQQGSAPAHRARETVQLLHQETSQFISPDLWPPNTVVGPKPGRLLDLGWMQELVYKTLVRDTNDLNRASLTEKTQFPGFMFLQVMQRH